jgi:hypothetical protein
MMKVLLRAVAPLFSLILDTGTANALASCLATSLLALPSLGVAVVLILKRPSLTPQISLRLPRGWTRTAMTSWSSVPSFRVKTGRLRAELVCRIAE